MFWLVSCIILPEKGCLPVCRELLWFYLTLFQKQSENMFRFVGNEIGSFELYLRKSSDLVFPRKVRCFKLHTTKNMFWLVGNKIGFFELHIAKNSDFAFCLLKHVALTQRSVRRNVVSFPALLHGKKVFLLFAASHPAFLLILLKTTFFLVIG